MLNRTKAVNEKLAMELLANEGFAVNVRRGTAHIFSVEALERFLKANQLTHLVRAHEVAQAGFQVSDLLSVKTGKNIGYQMLSGAHENCYKRYRMIGGIAIRLFRKVKSD